MLRQQSITPKLNMITRLRPSPISPGKRGTAEAEIENMDEVNATTTQAIDTTPMNATNASRAFGKGDDSSRIRVCAALTKRVCAKTPILAPTPPSMERTQMGWTDLAAMMIPIKAPAVANKENELVVFC